MDSDKLSLFELNQIMEMTSAYNRAVEALKMFISTTHASGPLSTGTSLTTQKSIKAHLRSIKVPMDVAFLYRKSEEYFETLISQLETLDRVIFIQGIYQSDKRNMGATVTNYVSAQAKLENIVTVGEYLLDALEVWKKGMESIPSNSNGLYIYNTLVQLLPIAREAAQKARRVVENVEAVMQPPLVNSSVVGVKFNSVVLASVGSIIGSQ